MGPRAMRSLPATSSQPGVPWGLLSTVPTSHTGEASLGHSQQQRHKFERSGLPWGLPEILWGYLSLPRRVSELQVWSKCCACLWGDVSLAPGTGKGNNWGEQPSSLSPSSSAPTPLCTQSLSQEGPPFSFCSIFLKARECGSPHPGVMLADWEKLGSHSPDLSPGSYAHDFVRLRH